MKNPLAESGRHCRPVVNGSLRMVGMTVVDERASKKLLDKLRYGNEGSIGHDLSASCGG